MNYLLFISNVCVCIGSLVEILSSIAGTKYEQLILVQFCDGGLVLSWESVFNFRYKMLAGEWNYGEGISSLFILSPAFLCNHYYYKLIKNQWNLVESYCTALNPDSLASPSLLMITRSRAAQLLWIKTVFPAIISDWKINLTRLGVFRKTLYLLTQRMLINELMLI